MTKESIGYKRKTLKVEKGGKWEDPFPRLEEELL